MAICSTANNNVHGLSSAIYSHFVRLRRISMSEIISVEELDAKFNHIPDEVIEKVNHIILTAARNDKRSVEIETEELRLTQTQMNYLIKLLGSKGFDGAKYYLNNKISKISVEWN